MTDEKKPAISSWFLKTGCGGRIDAPCNGYDREVNLSKTTKPSSISWVSELVVAGAGLTPNAVATTF